VDRGKDYANRGGAMKFRKKQVVVEGPLRRAYFKMLHDSLEDLTVEFMKETGKSPCDASIVELELSTKKYLKRKGSRCAKATQFLPTAAILGGGR
jgi:hypothetical protein